MPANIESEPLVSLSRAYQQIQILKQSGWVVRCFHVDHVGHQLLVDGTDNCGQGFRGAIDTNGNLSGEPVYN